MSIFIVFRLSSAIKSPKALLCSSCSCRTGTHRVRSISSDVVLMLRLLLMVTVTVERKLPNQFSASRLPFLHRRTFWLPCYVLQITIMCVALLTDLTTTQHSSSTLNWNTSASPVSFAPSFFGPTARRVAKLNHNSMKAPPNGV